MEKMTKSEQLAKLATVKSEVIKLECLVGTELEDLEFKVRQLTIAESKKYVELSKKSSEKAIAYVCSCAMIDPTYFTEEQQEQLNGLGQAITDEIFVKIPIIGLSETEKEKYYENIKTFMENQKDTVEVDEEKKQ